MSALLLSIQCIKCIQSLCCVCVCVCVCMFNRSVVELLGLRPKIFHAAQ